MVGVFEPKQQQVLKIAEHAEFVLNGASLVSKAFPAPGLAVPGQPTHRSVLPGNVCRNARTQDEDPHQCEAPIQLRGTQEVPKQKRKKAEKP